MKLITKDIDYAVKALLSIARNEGQKKTVSELAQELRVPYPFLRKIFRLLSQRGVLSSSKGKAGGFKLAKAPEKIWLTDLIQIFHGPIELAECVFQEKFCPDIKTCPLRTKIVELQQLFLSELKAITIASLLEQKAHPSRRQARLLPKSR